MSKFTSTLRIKKSSLPYTTTLSKLTLESNGLSTTYEYDAIYDQVAIGSVAESVRGLVENVVAGGNSVVLTIGEGKNTILYNEEINNGKGVAYGLIYKLVEYLLKIKKYKIPIKINFFETESNNINDLGKYYSSSKSRSSAAGQLSTLNEEDDETILDNEQINLIHVTTLEESMAVISQGLEKKSNEINISTVFAVNLYLENNTVSSLIFANLANNYITEANNLEKLVSIYQSNQKPTDTLLNKYLSNANNNPMACLITSVALSNNRFQETCLALSTASSLRVGGAGTNNRDMIKMQEEISQLRNALLNANARLPDVVPSVSSLMGNRDTRLTNLSSSRPQSALLNNPRPSSVSSQNNERGLNGERPSSALPEDSREKRPTVSKTNTETLSIPMNALVTFLTTHELDPNSAVQLLSKQLGLVSPRKEKEKELAATASVGKKASSIELAILPDDQAISMMMAQMDPKQRKFVDALLKRESYLKNRIDKAESEANEQLNQVVQKNNKAVHNVSILKETIRTLTQELQEAKGSINQTAQEQLVASKTQVQTLMTKDSVITEQQNQKIAQLLQTIQSLQVTQAAFNTQEQDWKQKLMVERKLLTKTKEEELNNMKEQYEFWLEKKTEDLDLFVSEFEAFKIEKNRQAKVNLDELSTLYEYIGFLTTIIQNMENGVYPITEKTGIKNIKFPDDMKKSIYNQETDSRRGKYVVKAIAAAKNWFQDYTQRALENPPKGFESSQDLAMRRSGTVLSNNSSMRNLHSRGNLMTSPTSNRSMLSSASSPTLNRNSVLNELSESEAHAIEDEVYHLSTEELQHELVELKKSQRSMAETMDSISKLRSQTLADLAKNETIQYIKKVEEERNHYRVLLATETKRLEELRIAHQAQNRLLNKAQSTTLRSPLSPSKFGMTN